MAGSTNDNNMVPAALKRESRSAAVIFGMRPREDLCSERAGVRGKHREKTSGPKKMMRERSGLMKDHWSKALARQDGQWAAAQHRVNPGAGEAGQTSEP